MRQRAISIVYHDVISGVDPDYSGFSGADGAEYKITLDEFDAHLRAIEYALKRPVVTSLQPGEYDPATPPVMLTFDDGGVSSYEHIAPMLESRDWRGLFFITTNRIDTPAFLSSGQIKELHLRGHVIGSHSCSHPHKMSGCTHEQLLTEWSQSLSVLSGIIGETVHVASIPGGFYSRLVAETAAKSGVTQLFSSEPLQKIRMVNGCAVIGRFSVKRGMGPEVPVEIVTGNRLRRFRQYAYWNLKKVAKAVAPSLYSHVRMLVLDQR